MDANERLELLKGNLLNKYENELSKIEKVVEEEKELLGQYSQKFQKKFIPSLGSCALTFDDFGGDWVCVGAAKNGRNDLWVFPDTWFKRMENYGDIFSLNPSTSTFNADAFVNYKGTDILLLVMENGKISDWGYAENAFYGESWRDVYLKTSRGKPNGTGWPSIPGYDREITITAKSRETNQGNPVGGCHFTSAGNYTKWYIMARDEGGDNYSFFTTVPYALSGDDSRITRESDQGIGANESGKGNNQTWFPTKDLTNSKYAFDFGTNRGDSLIVNSFKNKTCFMFIR